SFRRTARAPRTAHGATMTERLMFAVTFDPACGYVTTDAPQLSALSLAGLRRQLEAAYADAEIILTLDKKKNPLCEAGCSLEAPTGARSTGSRCPTRYNYPTRTSQAVTVITTAERIFVGEKRTPTVQGGVRRYARHRGERMPRAGITIRLRTASL